MQLQKICFFKTTLRSGGMLKELSRGYSLNVVPIKWHKFISPILKKTWKKTWKNNFIKNPEFWPTEMLLWSLKIRSDLQWANTLGDYACTLSVTTKFSGSQIGSLCHDGGQLYKQFWSILLRFWDEFLGNCWFTYQLQRVVTSSILNRFQSLDIRWKAKVPIRSFPVSFGSFDIGIV